MALSSTGQKIPQVDLSAPGVRWRVNPTEVWHSGHVSPPHHLPWQTQPTLLGRGASGKVVQPYAKELGLEEGVFTLPTTSFLQHKEQHVCLWHVDLVERRCHCELGSVPSEWGWVLSPGQKAAPENGDCGQNGRRSALNFGSPRDEAGGFL